MFSVACPRCGSRLVYGEINGFGEKGSLALFLIGLFNLVMGWLIRRAAAQAETGYYKCLSCSHVWRAR